MPDFADDPRVVRLMTPRPEAEPQHLGAALPTLPDTFWNARWYLEEIRAFARWKRVSPEALLIHAFCRSGPAGHPDALVKLAPWESPLRLSVFACVVQRSGLGKSKTARAAETMISGPEGQMGLPIGSGQGLADAFLTEVPVAPAAGEKKGAKEKRQTLFAAHFDVDEGQALLSLMKQQASVLGESLRRALTGATLGQRNASADRCRIVKNYVLSLSVSATPEVAAKLINEGELGTPQRFLWALGSDPLRARNPEKADTPILRAPEEGTIEFPKDVWNELDERHYRLSKDEIEIDPLDTHAPIIRGRVAAILAIWDGRNRVSLEDWALSGVIWDYSCKVRAMTIEQAEALEADEQAREGVRRGRMMAVQFAEANAAPAKTERLAERLARWLHDTGAKATRNALAHRAAHPERHLVAAALEHATSQGWVRAEGDRFAACGTGPR